MVVSVWGPINAISLSFNISWYTMPIHWAWVIYSLIPRPFLVGGVRKGRGRKGLVKNSTPWRKGKSFLLLPFLTPPTRKGPGTKLGDLQQDTTAALPAVVGLKLLKFSKLNNLFNAFY